MTTKTISVYQAMVDLKTMKKRLDSAMSELRDIVDRGNNPFNKKSEALMKIPFIGIKSKSAKEYTPEQLEDQNKMIQSNFDTYSHLIGNIEAYSAAISQSNAVTKVVVAGVEYTVAEAIKRKELASNKRLFLDLVKKQVTFANYAVATKNSEVEAKWLDTLKTLTKDATIELAPEFIEKQKEDFYANNTYEVIDPLKHTEKIDAMIAAFESFVDEVDTVLTTSNVQTLITINLAD